MFKLIQFSSVIQSCLTLCDPKDYTARQASLSTTNSWSLHKLMPIESVMPSISSSVVAFSSCLQSFPASESFQMSQFFTSGGQSIGSFSFSISPSIEYSGLISFSIDWFDLFTVQGTLKSLLQHHSSTPLGSFHPILWLQFYIDNSLNCITYLTARSIPIFLPDNGH